VDIGLIMYFETSVLVITKLASVFFTCIHTVLDVKYFIYYGNFQICVNLSIFPFFRISFFIQNLFKILYLKFLYSKFFI